MEKIEAFKVWAPTESKWSQWVKPVAFMGNELGNINEENKNLKRLATFNHDAIIIVDMPEESGVFYGLELARQGFRPIPLYNSVPGPRGMSLVKMEGIKQALIEGATELTFIPLRKDAPPAFLVDSKRMSGPINIPGKYDNRSWVFPQDMPSANFLLENQIKKVILLQENKELMTDISQIVYRYQEAGLEISRFRTINCQPIKINAPSKSILKYRFRNILGLRRHRGGGFGGIIPDENSSNSRHRSG